MLQLRLAVVIVIIDDCGECGERGVLADGWAREEEGWLVVVAVDRRPLTEGRFLHESSLCLSWFHRL